MKQLLCIGVALGLIVIASSLTCKTCDFRAVSLCFTGSSTPTCKVNETCFNTKAKIGSVSLFSRQGCMSDCKESTNKTDSTFNFEYETKCCNTDQCNSGNSMKISLSLGLGIGLLWLLNAV